MSPKPATKRSVALVIVLAMISVACLALATRANARQHNSSKVERHAH